jgi:hypothetical protein
MSKSKAIKDALVTLLSGLSLNGEPAFTAVKGNPRGEFDGFPSVRVLPGDQSTDKGAVGQNDRTVNYIVSTHVPTTATGTEFDYMYDLTDLIIDSLDQADFDNTLNLTDSGIDTYILNCSRGDWFDTDSQAGPLLSCEVNVEVKYSKNL